MAATATVEAPKRESAEDQARRSADLEFASHRMTVLRDDGVYRHLRFIRPGTWLYGFNLVTWPGHLFVGGDIEDFVFAREPDMFDFFRFSYGDINPGYWAEKIVAGRKARAWSVDRLSDKIDRALKGDEDADAIKEAWREETVDWVNLTHPESAVTALVDFRFEGRQVFDDAYEWEPYDWDWHFLRACHAIVKGIGLYDWAKGYGGETQGNGE